MVVYIPRSAKLTYVIFVCHMRPMTYKCHIMKNNAYDIKKWQKSILSILVCEQPSGPQQWHPFIRLWLYNCLKIKIEIQVRNFFMKCFSNSSLLPNTSEPEFQVQNFIFSRISLWPYCRGTYQYIYTNIDIWYFFICHLSFVTYDMNFKYVI